MEEPAGPYLAASGASLHAVEGQVRAAGAAAAVVVGGAVVKQAVAAGHEVTAFVHSKADQYQISGVRVLEGDASDRAAVDAAVLGQDAVLDTIGGKTPYRTTTLESGAANIIIASMQQNGVRRLVVTSMLGVGDSKANASILKRLFVSTFLRGADQDKTAMESAVEASGLDWVILRPAILNDDPAKRNVRDFSVETGEKAHTITCADPATFMIAQLPATNTSTKPSPSPTNREFSHRVLA